MMNAARVIMAMGGERLAEDFEIPVVGHKGRIVLEGRARQGPAWMRLVVKYPEGLIVSTEVRGVLDWDGEGVTWETEEWVGKGWVVPAGAVVRWWPHG